MMKKTMNKKWETLFHAEYTLISGLLLYMQTDELLFDRFFNWKVVCFVFFFSTMCAIGIIQLARIWLDRKPKNGDRN